MKYYQVHLHIDGGSSAGFEYFCNRKDAEKFIRENGVPDENYEIKIIEVKPTKAGIMWALRQYASHADNG